MRVVLYIAVAFGLASAFGQTSNPQVNACWNAQRHGKREEAKTCFIGLTRNGNPAVRAEAAWGLHQYPTANNLFREAAAAAPKNAEYKVRWGRMFHARYNDDDAQKLFSEALEIDKNNAQALLGLALVASDGFEEKAVSFAEQALKQDPKLVEAQELLAQLALEDNDPDRAIAEADKAMKMSPEALDAMAIRAAVEVLRDKSPAEWYDKIAKINPTYGDAYSLVGHFLVINRRYEEGILAYRKAIELDPDLDDARSELGVNLMRLGQDEEARKLLVKAYENGYRNALTANSLTLLDSYKNFVTFRTPTTIVKLHKKEAELLRPYVEGELQRAITTYEQKYKMKLKGPVQVEVYPDHEDFAVRTMGLPGLGALGVTFGNVVAMDSPSGRRPGSFHWASTLWHELSHVYVLSATNHRVPRWFTEGLAVYEETATSPDWGDRLDPGVIAAIKGKKLLPIAQLDRGFIRPSYPNQVVVSYFQAGKICEFIAQTWGYDKLLAMVQSFAELKTTPQVIADNLDLTPEAFDKKFFPWLDAKTGKSVDNFDKWKGQMVTLNAAAKDKKYDDVIRVGKEIRDLFPDYVEHGSVYELMGDAYAAKNDKASAIAELEAYSKIGGRNPETIKKLARMLKDAGRSKDAAAALDRLNFIYPMDAEAHRMLGDLWMETGNPTGAAREYGAVVAAKPIDPAESHYNLARALRAANRQEEARDQLLMSLEAAPGFKPAQRMLLEIAK